MIIEYEANWDPLTVHRAGTRIMSEANTERMTTCFASRGIMIRNMSGVNTALFWSVKSLWFGVERQRNGG
ncbi:MAG: hypothetical protein PHS38_09460 [Bacteroidales bacterium]|nr:hypothetical protein [Bacteroidales bacterium]